MKQATITLQPLEGLPRLRGSDKQVVWAEKLRQRAVLVALASVRGTTGELLQSACDQIQALLEQDAAAWWIDHRNDDFDMPKRAAQSHADRLRTTSPALTVSARVQAREERYEQLLARSELPRTLSVAAVAYGRVMLLRVKPDESLPGLWYAQLQIPSDQGQGKQTPWVEDAPTCTGVAESPALAGARALAEYEDRYRLTSEYLLAKL
jgi:hypothetical protein